MEKHRIREAEPIDGRKESHKFIELEMDRWIEINSSSIIDHDSIHKFLEDETKTKKYNIGYDTRAFEIGIIKNWKEVGKIK